MEAYLPSMQQATIHDQLQGAVREYVLGVLPPDGSSELSAMPLRDLLTTFFNSQDRLIPAHARDCHVSAEMRASAKFTEHSHDLVFAVFTGTDAYLIGVYDHRSWGLTEVLKIVVRNWPNAGLMLETHAIGLSQDFSDDERLELRKNGINTVGVVVDNKLWVPSALGISLDGSSSRAGRRAMDFVR
jgi:hypothetical protein